MHYHKIACIHFECTNRALQALDSKIFGIVSQCVTTAYQITSFIDIKHKAFCDYANKLKYEKQQDSISECFYYYLSCSVLSLRCFFIIQINCTRCIFQKFQLKFRLILDISVDVCALNHTTAMHTHIRCYGVDIIA